MCLVAAIVGLWVGILLCNIMPMFYRWYWGKNK